MLRAVLSGIRPRRLVPTVIAVLLAVGFVVGTFVFGDTTRAALVDGYARTSRGVDVAVSAAPDGRLPLSTVDDVRAVPGVTSAAGRMREPLPLLDRAGRLVSGLAGPGYAVDVSPGFGASTGRLPSAPGEAAIDRNTAGKTGYRVGDEITVLDTAERPQRRRLVGVADLTTALDSTAPDGVYPIVVLARDDLVRLTGSTGLREVVAAVDGDPAAVRAALPVPPGGRTRTGDELRHDLAEKAFSRIDLVLLALRLFGAVAALVAGFVSHNTFTILVAQRIRETALLRCVGAGRAQVFRLVLAEAAVVGVAGVVPGLLVGIAVGAGLYAGVTRLSDGGIAPHSPVVTAVPVVLAVLLGLALPLAAALLPAWRATRVPPVAALRIEPLGRSRPRWPLVVLALLAFLGGTALTARSWRADSAETALVIVIAGGALNFVALLLLSPLLVGRLVALLGWLPGRLFGVPARLATENARRNPGRTAPTAAALLIGITMMAGGSTIAASLTRTGEEQLNLAFPVDYMLTPAEVGRGATQVPAAAVSALRADPAFDLVAGVRLGTTPSGMLVGSIDPAAFGTAFRPQVTAGSLADLKPGGAVLAASSDLLRGKTVGDPVDVAGPDGTARRVTVVAVVQSSSRVGDIVVTADDFAAVFPQAAGESMVLVRARTAGAPARERLDAALREFPLVDVRDLAEVREQDRAQIQQLVAIVAALLAVTLVIALVGIANTLSLSVLERTRESALVRALGLTRRQLAATLVVEALLMAGVGAVVGVAYGIGYGWLTMKAAFGNIEPVLTIPYAQLALVVLVAAAAGVTASLLPARRAARSTVVAALSD
ncbi:ABC transporter permease [Virgisporangium aliadipatigenens]|nr:FtsX-like permease family protein [Virgisporangium aliadipatigenens]